MSNNVAVSIKGCSKFLAASKDFQVGEEILKISGLVTASPTMHSMQTGMDEHTQIDNIARYTNHKCCTPNGYYDSSYTPWMLKCLRPIKKGESITYDYVTTEYKMSDEFNCDCGNEKCRKYIRGFFYLSKEEKEQLIADGLVSSVIKEMHNRDQQ